ncbi:hypothetical protein [Mesorhizobium sp. B2-4-6]|uniref:hypothetical protein n=1 Tax=Mesorhizobium sp. B2-4-6 TaxID=2589943 RepID=UPI00112BB1AF|nr:hypothetical protein [Mesorhizobium sp. B2-4-6]TPL45336.1 hypothetical protein FJ957_20720 [Mesorhizobium sp. B2-4-6]
MIPAHWTDTYANGQPWAIIDGTPIYRVWTQGGRIPLHYWRSLVPRTMDYGNHPDFDLRNLPGYHAGMSDDEIEEIIRAALEADILP